MNGSCHLKIILKFMILSTAEIQLSTQSWMVLTYFKNIIKLLKYNINSLFVSQHNIIIISILRSVTASVFRKHSYFLKTVLSIHVIIPFKWKRTGWLTKSDRQNRQNPVWICTCHRTIKISILYKLSGGGRWGIVLRLISVRRLHDAVRYK